MRFYYELASELGYTVGDLLASVSSEELTYWKALYRLRHEESKKK